MACDSVFKPHIPSIGVVGAVRLGAPIVTGSRVREPGGFDFGRCGTAIVSNVDQLVARGQTPVADIAGQPIVQVGVGVAAGPRAAGLFALPDQACDIVPDTSVQRASFEPDFFFDEQMGHIEHAALHVASGHVASGVSNPER